MNNATTPTAERVTARRRNIILASDTEAKGEALATLEKRSFSNLLEVLIDREFERIQKSGASVAVEPAKEKEAVRA